MSLRAVLRTIAIRGAERLPGGLVGWLGTGSRARLLRPVVNRLVGEAPAVVVVQSGPAAGIRVVADMAGEKHYWVGQREPHVLEALVTEVSPGQTVWDIGAHIGFVAFLAAKLVGTEGAVVAFEPVPENRVRLARGCELNRLANVHVRSEAVGRADGMAVLAAGPSSLEWSLEVTRHDRSRGIEVEVATIDSLVAQLEVPDLIKIDVEGVELDTLCGGALTLRSHHPKVIVEFTTPELVREAQNLFPEYEFTHLGDNHWLMT